MFALYVREISFSNTESVFSACGVGFCWDIKTTCVFVESFELIECVCFVVMIVVASML